MVCPRCDSSDARPLFTAEDQQWQIFGCPTCSFNWRSTEGNDIKDGSIYDRRFKLDKQRIQEMAPKPSIPPLRRQISEE